MSLSTSSQDSRRHTDFAQKNLENTREGMTMLADAIAAETEVDVESLTQCALQKLLLGSVGKVQ